MKKKILVILSTFLIFFTGLSMLLYPMFSNAWNERRSRELISGYTEQVAQIPKEDYSEWFDRADDYNRRLRTKKIPDAFAESTEEADAEYISELAMNENGIMGYIEIPRISVSLPIYHTTTPEVLERGVGHLQGSALPVGGESTHCVLSAHRGLPSAALFTDLDMLKEGDHFYIHVLDRILAYEVDQIKEVKPEETEDLAVTPGKDYVTLITCTPYGVNTHRLLVRGHRVEYVEETAAVEADSTVSSVHTRYGLWVAGGLIFTLCFSIVLVIILKKRGASNE